MKRFLIDLVFAALYLVVLVMGVFGFLKILYVSILLFAILLANILYRFAVSVKAEEMGREYVEAEKIKDEYARRKAIINGMIKTIDSMALCINRLRVLFHGRAYVYD